MAKGGNGGESDDTGAVQMTRTPRKIVLGFSLSITAALYIGAVASFAPTPLAAQSVDGQGEQLRKPVRGITGFRFGTSPRPQDGAAAPDQSEPRTRQGNPSASGRAITDPPSPQRPPVDHGTCHADSPGLGVDAKPWGGGDLVVLSEREFRTVFEKARQTPRRKRLISERQLRKMLGETAAWGAGKLAETAVTRPLGLGFFAGRLASPITGPLIADPVEELVRAYFEDRWRHETASERLARLMDEARVAPEGIQFDRNAIYRGRLGLQELWVEMLVITQQQHMIEQARNEGSVLPNQWLDDEIRAACAVLVDIQWARVRGGLPPSD